MAKIGSSDGLREGSRVELEITALVAGGEGLGRIDGRVVFVRDACPGDVLLVEITSLERAFGRARVVARRREAPDRREPRCRHAGTCGGCAWQHVSASAQRAAKAGIVRDALRRIAGLDWSAPIDVLHAEEYGYRTRADLVVGRREDGRRVLGYRASRSHDVVVADECPVLEPRLGELLARCNSGETPIPRSAASARFACGDTGASVEFLDRDGRPVAGAEDDTGRPSTVVRTVAGLRQSFAARAFWQSHAGLLAELVTRATQGVGDGEAWDLYAGAGLFSLHLARGATRVVGVESDARSVACARQSADDNRIANVQFHAGDVLAFLRERDAGPAFVLLDPPRKGLEPGVVDELARLRPERLRYVSCDPATLARDLRGLVAHGWSVTNVVALDLFPQTPHVETIVDVRPAPAAPEAPAPR